MSIFTEVKELVSARQAAEYYGLKVNAHGMACCPFHDDHHPSLKLDRYYYCFGCGAKGDSINYVAQKFQLTQFGALQQMVQDFNLPVDTGRNQSGKNRLARMKYQREKQEKEKIAQIQQRFHDWCKNKVEELQQAETDIQAIKESFLGSSDEEVFSSEEFALAINAENRISDWLDILLLRGDIDRLELYKKCRKEVDRNVNEVSDARRRILERDRSDHGQRIQRCG